jgi:hypothetical protein
MFRLLMTCFAVAMLLASLSFAHDERLHKDNALTGEIVSVTADGLQLKTKMDTVTVRFSSKTKFELDKKAVDKSQVRQGDRAGVIGNKLPTGEVMANEVILGLPAPGAAADAGAKKAEPKN